MRDVHSVNHGRSIVRFWTARGSLPFAKKKIKNYNLYRLESIGDFSAQSSVIVMWQKERKNHLGMTEVRMIFFDLSGAQKYLRARD